MNIIQNIESYLNITHPDTLISDLSHIQTIIDSYKPYIRRDIRSFRYRPKWSNGKVVNHSKLFTDIDMLYDVYDHIRTTKEYIDFIDKYRDLTVYRGVYNTPYYNVLNWKIGDTIPHAFPMSSSIYADAPLRHTETDDNTGVFMRIKVPIDSLFFVIFTDREVAYMSRDETKSLFTDGRMDSEITLMPGNLTLVSKYSISDITIYDISYTAYTRDEWMSLYDEYKIVS